MRLLVMVQGRGMDEGMVDGEILDVVPRYSRILKNGIGEELEGK